MKRSLQVKQVIPDLQLFLTSFNYHQYVQNESICNTTTNGEILIFFGNGFETQSELNLCTKKRIQGLLICQIMSGQQLIESRIVTLVCTSNISDAIHIFAVNSPATKYNMKKLVSNQNPFIIQNNISSYLTKKCIIQKN